MLNKLKRHFIDYLQDEGGWIMAAVAVAGAITSAYGSYKAGKAQSKAMEDQARINFLKAEEILERNAINNSLLEGSALVHQGKQTVQSFGSGKSLASSRRLIDSTMALARQQMELNTRAAEWEAEMTRLGAESTLSAAKDVRTAGNITSIGQLGFGLAKAYESMPGPSSPGKKPSSAMVESPV